MLIQRKRAVILLGEGDARVELHSCNSSTPVGLLVDKQPGDRGPTDKAPHMGSPIDSWDGKSDSEVNSDCDENSPHPNAVASTQYQDRPEETEYRT